MTLAQLAITALMAGVALALIMTSAWGIWWKTGNSGWIDASWSFGVGAVAFAVVLFPFDAHWPNWRELVVAVLAAAWCLRLGGHIGRRTRTATDDPRYRALIALWGAQAPRQMFCFVQSQAAVGVVLVLAIAVAARNPEAGFRLQDAAGLVILLTAIAGEAIADHQLRSFNAAHHRGVCEVGLWRWSRHPNYFFEWLVWVAFPVLAVDFAGRYPLGWLALAAPISMYWVLVRVSGIPPLEAHMLRTRGDAFREYQARTSAFFPRPPLS